MTTLPSLTETAGPSRVPDVTIPPVCASRPMDTPPAARQAGYAGNTFFIVGDDETAIATPRLFLGNPTLPESSPGVKAARNSRRGSLPWKNKLSVSQDGHSTVPHRLPPEPFPLPGAFLFKNSARSRIAAATAGELSIAFLLGTDIFATSGKGHDLTAQPESKPRPVVIPKQNPPFVELVQMAPTAT